MRIACVGYRQWALNIYDDLANSTDHAFLIFRSKAQYNEEVLRDFKPDLVLFYGWSWYIKQELLNDIKCLMLHPSPLPKYRGGSPIQNQIIAGETDTQVSIFVMNEELDAGDIVGQQEISLEGPLQDVFDRIEKAGMQLTRQLLKDGLHPKPQDHSKATYCKRRTLSESEITLSELQNSSSNYLYNKIRMLADPYPNAYFKTKDGKKLIITDARIES